MILPRTEARAADAPPLDLLDPDELAERFARADLEAVQAVAAAKAQLARAMELTRDALAAGGRLLLSGAGTSGRLAVLEAAECRPTFSCKRVQALIAGGQPALLVAQEGAEDDRARGVAELRELDPRAPELLIGISASGRTPYVLGTLEAARAAGARTALLCCSPPPPAVELDLLILLATGPEALSGSTRMKAGTATKCALNAITTGAMALLGKVMDDLMVDVVPSNTKLVARARRIVGTLVPCADDRAASLLDAAGGEVKVAVVMGRRDLDPESARARLRAAGGHLRRALEAAPAGS